MHMIGRVGVFSVALGSLLLAIGCGGAQESLATVTASGVISDFLSGSALAGVEVCVHGTQTCTTTTSSGSWSLAIADGSDVTLHQVLADYEPKLTSLRTAGKQLTVLGTLTKKSDIALLGTTAGTTVDLGKAILTINVFDAAGHGIEGVTMALGNGDGEGPYWETDTGYTKMGSTTSSHGAVAWINAAAGLRVVTATKAGLTCTPNGNVPGPGAGTTNLTLEAGFLSAAGFLCQ